MSVDSEPNTHLTTEPVEMGNQKYLELYLNDLEEKYSEDELSGLAFSWLKAEEQELIDDFKDLKRSFPTKDRSFTDKQEIFPNEDSPTKETYLRQIQMGNDYRGFSPSRETRNSRYVIQNRDCVGILEEKLRKQ
ncbi:hypothetical protein BG842_07600 [Haladaptatus sp. W1]|uniref:hypothetical protein n=1 Tax=Haladaptatus sp. W1 TaxID=1897478 RepID=UPI0008497DF3|nr:hypothetical protein [Haladaptatus sp. W1]ODR80319.1 hypothetical protein BG842_07600 [Haladaptatus sp. W1]